MTNGGIGAGCYALCRLDQARATKARHYLVMLNPKLASGLRVLDQYALIGLRPDWGKDGEQADANRTPEAEAQRWADLIRGRVAEAGVGVYNYTLGINEPLGMPLDWLAVFEYWLCRHVQYGEAMPEGWRLLPYAAISGQVGHLEHSEVIKFAKVLEITWAVNFHAYLKEWIQGLLLEPDDWYVWRPLRLLMPEIVKINPKISLLLGECGTYYPAARTGLSKDDEARVQVGIAQAYEMEAAKRGYNYVGAISYGIGLDGDQRETWDLSEQLGIFAAANQETATVHPQPPVVPVVPAPLPPTPNGGKQVSDYPKALWVPMPSFGYPTGTHGRQGHLPVAIVDHIAQGYRAGAEARFRNPAERASSNYLVCRNGDVVQYVAESDPAWANGIVQRPDLTIAWLRDAIEHDVNPNLVTISIEHEGFSGQALTEPQYQSSLDLHRDIFKRHNWPVTDHDRAVGHNVIDGKDRPNDPGPAYNWARLWRDLAGQSQPPAHVDPIDDALNGLAAFGSWAREAASHNDWEGVRRNLDEQWDRLIRLKQALGKQ